MGNCSASSVDTIISLDNSPVNSVHSHATEQKILREKIISFQIEFEDKKQLVTLNIFNFSTIEQIVYYLFCSESSIFTYKGDYKYLALFRNTDLIKELNYVEQINNNDIIIIKPVKYPFYVPYHMYYNELSDYKKYHIIALNIKVNIDNEKDLMRVIGKCLYKPSLHELESIMIFLVHRCRKYECNRNKILSVSDIKKCGILFYE